MYCLKLISTKFKSFKLLIFSPEFQNIKIKNGNYSLYLFYLHYFYLLVIGWLICNLPLRYHLLFSDRVLNNELKSFESLLLYDRIYILIYLFILFIYYIHHDTSNINRVKAKNAMKMRKGFNQKSFKGLWNGTYCTVRRLQITFIFYINLG